MSNKQIAIICNHNYDTLSSQLNYLIKDSKFHQINNLDISKIVQEPFDVIIGDLMLDKEELNTITSGELALKQIRMKNPHVFLVGVKRTSGLSKEDQFLTSLKTMKNVKFNLMISHDIKTNHSIVVTAEESIYGCSFNLFESLLELVSILKLRMNGTYNPTNFIQNENTPISKTPESFQKVVKFLIENQGFIENNGNGFTPGHFCYKNSETTMISSQRKSNHNLVFEEGMSLVSADSNGVFTAVGKRKPSVGARSQWILLNAFKDYDCIVHTHNPLIKEGSINTVDQRPFQCGSIECGINTLNGITDYNGIKAVYLNKHGANIIFKSSDDPDKIIEFIKSHLKLGIKAS